MKIYVTGCEKSCFNQDSNPGPQAYWASFLTTELVRPDILTDNHTLVNKGTEIRMGKKFTSMLTLQNNTYISINSLTWLHSEVLGTSGVILLYPLRYIHKVSL